MNPSLTGLDSKVGEVLSCNYGGTDATEASRRGGAEGKADRIGAGDPAVIVS
jgi:hypothetical protein